MLVLPNYLLLLPFLTTTLYARNEPDTRLFSACSGPSGEDPVHLAEEALIDGANINLQDEESGQTPLMAAVLRGKVNIVKFLLEKGADVTIGEKQGYTPSHGAGFQGRKEIMQILEDKAGVDVMNDAHEDGFLPFHRACWGREGRHTELVGYFLEKGMDVNIRALNGKTCMDMTTNKATGKLLMENGARERSSSSSEHSEL